MHFIVAIVSVFGLVGGYEHNISYGAIVPLTICVSKVGTYVYVNYLHNSDRFDLGYSTEEAPDEIVSLQGFEYNKFKHPIDSIEQRLGYDSVMQIRMFITDLEPFTIHIRTDDMHFQRAIDFIQYSGKERCDNLFDPFNKGLVVVVKNLGLNRFYKVYCDLGSDLHVGDRFNLYYVMASGDVLYDFTRTFIMKVDVVKSYLVYTIFTQCHHDKMHFTCVKNGKKTHEIKLYVSGSVGLSPLGLLSLLLLQYMFLNLSGG